MKYIKYIFNLTLLVLIFICFLKLLGFSGKLTIDKDRKFTNEFLEKNLRIGMKETEIINLFKSYNRKVGLWECAEEAETIEECKSEKALVVTLALPSNNIWLGKGDAQIYFYVNINNSLEAFDFELYYPRFH